MKIEIGVPIPKKRALQSGKWNNLLRRMPKGSSIGGLTEENRRCLISAARRLKFKIVSRKQEDGTIRVWKT